MDEGRVIVTQRELHRMQVIRLTLERDERVCKEERSCWGLSRRQIKRLERRCESAGRKGSYTVIEDERPGTGPKPKQLLESFNGPAVATRD